MSCWLALHKVLRTLGKFEGHNPLAAIAMPTPLLEFSHDSRSVIHCLEDRLYVFGTLAQEMSFTTIKWY